MIIFFDCFSESHSLIETAKVGVIVAAVDDDTDRPTDDDNEESEFYIYLSEEMWFYPPQFFDLSLFWKQHFYPFLPT